MKNMTTSHTWKFFRAGGFDQVQLDSGDDLLALKQLDQKLWVALSCPTRGIEFDTATLDMIDADGDGQVRASEVLAAICWAGSLFKNSDLLVKGADSLPLAEIDDSSDEGRQVLASARLILKSLGKAEAGEISLADLADVEKFVAGLLFNGDGVVCAEQIVDAVLRGIAEDIAKVAGTVVDASGSQGINQPIVERFFAEAAAYVEWYAKGEADAAILHMGAESAAAAEALLAVAAKVDDYFTRCQMAAYDARAALPLSRATEDYQQLAAKNLSAASEEVASFPLATIAADKPLPLLAGLNPAWRDKVEALRLLVVQPLLGEKQSLTAAEWSLLRARFAAFAEWQSAQPVSAVGELGVERLREMLAPAHQAAIHALIEQDQAVAAEIVAIHSVERLIRYQRDLFRLANNFVSFRDFYSGKGKGIFQVGTLYMDGRSCELCVRVEDVNAHATYANSSGVCLAYCELVRKGGAEKMNIAAAFTAGDADFLAVGRHGIFYDSKGLDWDATIVRIADHPISIRQAFWSPYKKLFKVVSEQMQKFAVAKAGNVDDKIAKAAVEHTASVVSAAPTAPKPPFDVAKFAGIFAAIGLAIGAIGGMLASITAGILSLKFWQIPFAMIGLMLAVSGPSMLLAAFKLKRRNLGPILDACGWAINARVHINIPFGTSLTALPSLPQGARRSLVDPYAEKKSAWPYVWGALLIAALLGWTWYAGYFG
jgi:hypothetical protein